MTAKSWLMKANPRWTQQAHKTMNQILFKAVWDWEKLMESRVLWVSIANGCKKINWLTKKLETHNTIQITPVWQIMKLIKTIRILQFANQS